MKTTIGMENMTGEAFLKIYFAISVFLPFFPHVLRDIYSILLLFPDMEKWSD